MRRGRNDILLLIGMGVLVVLAVMPAQEQADSEETAKGETPAAVKEPIIAPGEKPDAQKAFIQVNEAVRAMERHNDEIEKVLSPPIRVGNGFSIHPTKAPRRKRVFPVEAGTEWVYRVVGPEELVPHDTWTLRIVSEPDGHRPGLVESGFGDERTLDVFTLRSGSVVFEGLPFFEPTELAGLRPNAAGGELIPHMDRVIQGAVWTKESDRDIVYKYTDNRGKPHEQEARARQRDRASVGDFETVVTPAGRFGAHRIEWLSRVSIETKGRVVLGHLTTEPYRKETMWLAPGVGIVVRDIDYLQSSRVMERIQFDLLSFTPAEDCVFHDLDLKTVKR